MLCIRLWENVGKWEAKARFIYSESRLGALETVFERYFTLNSQGCSFLKFQKSDGKISLSYGHGRVSNHSVNQVILRAGQGTNTFSKDQGVL